MHAVSEGILRKGNRVGYILRYHRLHIRSHIPCSSCVACVRGCCRYLLRLQMALGFLPFLGFFVPAVKVYLHSGFSQRSSERSVHCLKGYIHLVLIRCSVLIVILRIVHIDDILCYFRSDGQRQVLHTVKRIFRSRLALIGCYLASIQTVTRFSFVLILYFIVEVMHAVSIFIQFPLSK